MQNEDTDKIMFSVIVPVYNGEFIIDKCLESLANQTSDNFEVIFVNDGSTDHSLDKLNNYKRKQVDRRIIVIDQKNSGAGQARNNGMNYANGEYLIFLDSDDYIDYTFIEEANAVVLRDDPDIVFVDLVREAANGKVIRFELMSVYKKLSKDAMIRQQLTGKIPWGGVRKIVKTQIVKEGGHRYGSISVGEESIYSFGILRDSEVISFMPGVYYHYYDNSQSLTAHDKPEYSGMVFNYICKELQGKGLYSSYEMTINALAATTVAITINVLAKQYSFRDALRLGRECLGEYNRYIQSQIDYEALESRVKICLPFLKAGMTAPVIFASYLQSSIKKLRR